MNNIRFGKKYFIFVSILFLLQGLTIAGNDIELNTDLMRSTFRLEGEGKLPYQKICGTVFILGKPMKKNPQEAYYILITASHILKDTKGDTVTLFLRKKNGNLYEKIPFQIFIRKEGKELWVNHPEVDVSAMYVPLPKDVDLSLLTTNVLANDKTFAKYEIHPGDELLCLGYPFSSEANSAGFPILRSGKIASFPIIPAKETRYFLFDFEVFGGNSGGPVYFAQTGRKYENQIHSGTVIQFIAGLVSQEYSVTEKINSRYEEQNKIYPLSLAKIIHASFIEETIDLLPSFE